MLDKATIHRITKRGVHKIIEEREFVQLLREGKPLRLKMGFDPSRPDIHLGHVVGLRKLRQLQELGHKVILIVGDWTAQIGDPSGQSVMRPMLSREEVVANAETYIAQFFRVVDRNKTQVVWQSEWFGKFGLEDVIRLTSRFTVAQFLAREDFSTRFKGGKPIAVTELLYPLLQAYDSVETRADVEFGGTDQEFNLLVGRDLQAMMGQRPQQCLLMPLLVGLDGVQKMSKSLDNYVGVEDPPEDMYGKLMSIPDSLIMDYFELLTDVEDSELSDMRQAIESDSVNPMELKKRLALEITSQFWGQESTGKAQEHFESVVQRGEPPEDITEIEFPLAFPADVTTVDLTMVLLWAKLVKGRSEAKRLLAQGAVEIDGVKTTDPQPYVRRGTSLLLKVGPRRWRRIRFVDADTSGAGSTRTS